MRTLLLTPYYFPHKILRWQDAICLLYLGKAESVVDYPSARVSSPSVTMNLPAVIRLKKLGSMKKGIRFSRANVYARDKFRCQYCGKKYGFVDLSYDHVVPRASGGTTEWTNIVTACKRCNSKKGDRSCDESGMFPMNPPRRPSKLPMTSPRFDHVDVPEEWEPFLKAGR